MRKWFCAMVSLFMLVCILQGCSETTGNLGGSSEERIETFLETGNYQEAYEVAQSDEERSAVLAENVVAFCYQDYIGSLEPTLDHGKTFDLYGAWYDRQEQFVVLKGTFHAGGDSAVGYLLYEGKNSTYSVAFASFDLDPDSYEKTGDDRQDLAEKIYRTTEIQHINDTMSNGFSVNLEIGRITSFVETATMTIQLLPEATP